MPIQPANQVTHSESPDSLSHLTAVSDDLANPSNLTDKEIRLFQKTRNLLGPHFASWFDNLSPMQKHALAESDCELKEPASVLLFALQKKLVKGLPLRGLNLSGIDLSGYDLSELDFSYCDLTNAKLNSITANNTIWCCERITNAEFDPWKNPEILTSAINIPPAMANLIIKRNSEGMTPLMKAISDDRIGTVKAIINSPQLGQKSLLLTSNSNTHSETVLHWAIKSLKPAAVRAILDTPHASLALRALDGFFTPLHTAISLISHQLDSQSIDDCLKIIEMIALAPECDATVHESVCNGLTPIHLAVASKNLKAVEILLKSPQSKSSLAIAEKISGHTPLHTAIYWSEDLIAEAILDSGHTNAALLAMKSTNGSTPLQMALIQQRENVLTKMLATPHCNDALLVEYSRKKPLQWALESDNTDSAKKILASPSCHVETLFTKDKNRQYVLSGCITNDVDKQNFITFLDTKINDTAKAISRTSKTKIDTLQLKLNALTHAAKQAKNSLTDISGRMHLLEMLESTDRFINGNMTADDYSKRIKHFERATNHWAKPVLQIMGAILFATVAALAISCLAISSGASLPYTFSLNALMVLSSTTSVQYGYGLAAVGSSILAYNCALFAKRNIEKSQALPNLCKQIKKEVCTPRLF